MIYSREATLCLDDSCAYSEIAYGPVICKVSVGSVKSPMSLHYSARLPRVSGFIAAKELFDALAFKYAGCLAEKRAELIN